MLLDLLLNHLEFLGRHLLENLLDLLDLLRRHLGNSLMGLLSHWYLFLRVRHEVGLLLLELWLLLSLLKVSWLYLWLRLSVLKVILLHLWLHLAVLKSTDLYREAKGTVVSWSWCLRRGQRWICHVRGRCSIWLIECLDDWLL